MTQYFHISKKDLGDKVVLKPKIPESALPSKEGNIPRICVCPKIYNCIEAIVSVRRPTVGDFIQELSKDVNPFELFESNKLITYFSPSIYVSDEIPFLPPAASDYRRTKEHWYLKRTPFKRCGYLDLNMLLTTGKLNTVDQYNEIKAKYKDLLKLEVCKK